MIDPTKFGAELAAIVKGATAPLLARIDALEKAAEARVEPQDGKDGADGRDADPDEVAALVAEKMAHQIASMRKALDEIPEAPELPDIPAMISEAVAKAVAEIPAPKDGARGERGEKGDDGIGLAGALVDRDGGLVVTLTNGEAKSLGRVVGKDGAPGRDGSDGLGFDDLTFEADEFGRPIAKFQRGDVVKTFALPCIIDRGPYRAGEAYQKGDAVSYGGSLWIAQDATDGKPDGGKGWRLAVKKGRDARGEKVKVADA